MLGADPRVSDLLAIPDAYVPCLRLSFDGLDVDLTFASLPADALPPQPTAEPDWCVGGAAMRGALDRPWHLPALTDHGTYQP
jgi:hypothetical protein